MKLKIHVNGMYGKQLLGFFITAVFLSGCATIQSPYKIIETQKEEIRILKEKLQQSEEEFEAARKKLMEELSKQIEAGNVKIEKLRRGLVLTMLEEILFDSGKAEIKAEGGETLIKVAKVLKEDCPNNNISIEGHTDNVPIKYSGWKSNWELSAARANSVLHFFIDKCGIDPQMLNMAGFGEYRPAASNETEEGRQQNRRVEIVILPENIARLETGISQ